MENEILVKVDQVSKKFSKNLKTSLWYGFKDLFSNLKKSNNQKHLRPDEFWAVKNISFELRRGECIGLIGHNGAGKSTLLKILNGLINPDEGMVIIKGRVSALIELGAGFNPILSGRENIYNNGAVLGLSKEEIDTKIEDIIDFAEIREFIDMPVQNYSSGMKVRLGFAVASQIEPDVLIIDEVLAVGDLGFVLKCFKTIDQILPNTAIIFVSHSMPMISRICTQIILMERGDVKMQGTNVAKAIDLYYTHFSNTEKHNVLDDGSIDLIDCNILNYKSVLKDIKQIDRLDDLKINFKFKVNNPKINFEFFVIITDKEARPVALLESNKNRISNSNSVNKLEFSIEHKNIQLSKGLYSLSLSVRNKTTKEPVLRINEILNFQILHKNEIWEPFLLKSSFVLPEKQNSKISVDD